MSTQIQGRYFGKGGPLFRLYFVTALLTLVTLGIYRFWAKTRIRKYVWSAATGDGDGFEYTGTGLEKLLGFLVAIVILAVYLGVVQMVLFFVGLNLFVEPQSDAQVFAQVAAIYLNLLAILPLLFFAQYRARRYKMARTRWRGLRFGMDLGAWGYAGRAMGYYLLNILTLGLLTPLVSFRLEAYMADRSWYGDAPFVQGGRWQDLYRGMKHVFIGLGILVASVVCLSIGAVGGTTALIVLGGVAGFVSYIWIVIGVIAYRVHAFNYLTTHKVLDGTVHFSAALAPARVVTIVIFGTLAVGLLVGVIFAVAGGIGSAIFAAVAAGGGGFDGDFVSRFGFIAALVAVVVYAGALLVAGGLSLVMITQPVIEHAVNNVTVLNVDHLDTIRQRNADTGADAEGFADALDIGGAL